MSGEGKDVEFKALDGLTLCGWLFEGPKGGPAVIVNGAVSQAPPKMNIPFTRPPPRQMFQNSYFTEN